MSKLCIIYVAIAYVFTVVTTFECNFDVNTIQKLHDHATSFRDKYNFGLINSNPMSPFHEQYDNSCNGESCYLNYRVVNMTHLDDLRESYNIENNKFKPLSGQLLHGRDYKTTHKFTRYDFKRTDTGFTFKNADKDSENEEMFDIFSNDLSDNLQISKDLSPQSHSFVNDLITFHQKMTNFLDGLSEEDKLVSYYHHNGDDGKTSIIQFYETKDSSLNSITFELKSDGSIEGDFTCDLQTQKFNIENGKVVLQGFIETTGAYKKK